MSIYLNLIFISLGVVFLAAFIFVAIRVNYKAYLRLSGIFRAFQSFMQIEGFGKKSSIAQLDQDLKISGYAYDPLQDIFYSIDEPWQKKYGYCRLYDEALSPLGMITDSEPIYFKYKGKSWLIEFWKGQYDLSAGCEIGIYNSKEKFPIIGDFFNPNLYMPCSEEEELQMSFILKRKGEVLFKRSDKHWWLTGFRVGLYTEPEELTMSICIKFPDPIMCGQFVKALMKTGYKRNEFVRAENTVALVFGKPHSRQPFSRIRFTDALIQRKNKLMCETYNKVTKDCLTLQDKLFALQKYAPSLLKKLNAPARPEKIYKTKVPDSVKRWKI